MRRNPSTPARDDTMGNLHTTHLIHAFTVLIPYHTAPITEVVSTALITVNNH